MLNRRFAAIRPAALALFCLWLFQSTAWADPHRFVCDVPPNQHPSAVTLAGTFNGWSTSATPMHSDGNGVYSVTIDLPEGVTFYKFVLDGHIWLNDPNSDKQLEESDGNGGMNSAVLIGADGRKLPPPSPDTIEQSPLHHDPHSMEDCDVASPSIIRLRITAQDNDLDDASAVYRGHGNRNAGWERQAMWGVGRKLGLANWGTVIEFPPPSPAPAAIDYYFVLRHGMATLFISAAGVGQSESAAQDRPFSRAMKPVFTTPDWAKHAVWYQIFPERFRNGDPANDPPGTQRWQSKWFSTLPGEAPGDENFYKGEGNVWKRRYGGDIQGIDQALPYLRSLGITAIYLNPIFQAESSHKYDTTDYRHVEPNFGVLENLADLHETDDPSTWKWSKSDKVFLDFVADAHRQGFKVILDGVFNHVGRANWAFQDVLKNGRQSKYADWFDIYDWSPVQEHGNEHAAPFHYHAWDGDNGDLPAFKKDPQLGLVHGPREHIMGITKRWLAPDGDPSRGVDGWRLDVAEGIPKPFWVEWRKLVKTTKPDAYISGEIWGWAQSYLQGDEYDAVMNYRFAVLAQQFFVNQNRAISPSVFDDGCEELIWAYPLQASLVQMNLFDSHDTDRVASMFVNPDLDYDSADRIEDNGPNYSPAKPTAQLRIRQRQEAAFQMTFLGAPMIYYGDENGMWSPDDPSNRQPMVWKDKAPYDDPEVGFDDTMFNFYQRAIAVRRAIPALQVGSFHGIVTDDSQGIYAFEREQDGRHALVVLNRSPQAHELDLKVARPQDPAANAAFVDWMNPDETTVNSSSEGDTARPEIAIKAGAAGTAAKDGILHLSLQPYGTMVLTEKDTHSPR